MHTCCGRMLKFIRCVRNKLAESSDVGFGGDRRSCGHYGDRK